MRSKTPVNSLQIHAVTGRGGPKPGLTAYGGADQAVPIDAADGHVSRPPGAV